MRKLSFVMGLYLAVLTGTPRESFSQWIKNSPLGLTSPIINCLLVSGDTVFAGTSVGIFRSLDGGQTWAITNSGLENLYITFLTYAPNDLGGNRILAGTWGSGVYVSTNDGTIWSPSNSGLTNNLVGCFIASDTDLFVGTNGGLFSSSDHGRDWMPVNFGIVSPFGGTFSVTSLALVGDNLFAGIFGGPVFLSTNDGTSWAHMNSGIMGWYGSGSVYLAVVGESIFMTSGDDVIYGSNDTGKTWKQVLSLDYFNLASCGDDLYALGYHQLLVSSDRGASWTAIDSGLTNSYITSIGFSDAKLFAGTWTDGVFISTNSGTSWSATNSGLPNGEIRSLAVTQNAGGGFDLWTLTDDGPGHLSGGGGNTGLQNPFTNCLIGIHDGTDSTILVGTTNGISRSTDYGSSWISVDSGLTSKYINSLFVDSNFVFAGTNGGIFRTADAGTIWSSVNDGLANTSVNCLAAVDQYLFAGTKNGIFVSSDDGGNWRESDSGLANKSVNSIAVSGASLIAGTESGMYLSIDRGASWSKIDSGISSTTSVYSFVVSDSNIFAGTQNGVFLSTNGGISWTDANSGLTDTTVYSIVICGKTVFAAMHGRAIWSRPASEMGVTSVKSLIHNKPYTTVLDQNYPNPFNPSTNIRYQLRANSFVVLKVYDVLGRLVKTLVDESQNAGSHSVIFNGSSIPSGVYFYKLEAGTYHDTKKLLLLK